MENFHTLAGMFLLVTARERDELLRVKREGAWRSFSSAEFRRRVARLAITLERMGLRAGDRAGLLAENCPEWSIADFACITSGIVVVPIYPTLTAAQCEYILKNSAAKAVFVSTPELAAKITPPEIKVLMMEDLGRGEPLSEEENRAFEAKARAVKAEDLFSILYTSGTTGVPKGVMLTHHNICSNILASTSEVGPQDTALSFLPLCHVYERMADYLYLYRGASIAYVARLEEVPQALLEVRPTVMAAVPRFFEKLYARVMEAVHAASPLRQKLFAWAVEVGKRRLDSELHGRPVPPLLVLQQGVADRLVFRKMRERLGGRLRLIVSGSAPLARELAEFFLACGVTICEGYGLTETSPVLASNRAGSIRLGTVGRPIPGVEIKIAEDGEILARGPNIMKGYLGMPEETARVMRDGWFHTGDIGRLDADGYLSITDRKKDLLKTSGGKYVAPQPIENKLKTNPYIQNVVVLGDRRKFVSAVVVVNVEKLSGYARQNNIPFSSPGELVRHPRVIEFMQKQVDEWTPELAHFERIKKLVLLENDFSISDGTLTPTMKVKRNIIEKQYAEQIENLYRE